MKMIVLVGMLLLPTFLYAAPDYIVIRLYSGGESCIVVSPEEANKQKIAHLPKGVVIDFSDLKKKYNVSGVYGKAIHERDIPNYLAPTVASK
ncbi:MAG: hypothetical protein WC761_06825 [Candidatus Paceibacterota bacterium]|jgi:hypothetical protein